MDSLGLDDSDDPRDVELSSLNAIYPEIQQVRPDDRYTIAIDVPVTPSKAVVVSFPAAAEPTHPARPNVDNVENGANQVDQHELAHLPPVHLEITFGPGYPFEQPPKITISTTPPWLPPKTIKELEDDGPRLWEEMGRDIVGFTYIDHVHQAAERVFGLVDDAGTLEVDVQHKISILDYDIQARRAAFERETFDCGVCLDPKKGSVCHKMMDCGHVFCVQCLQDFYNDAIERGEIASVRCLAPGCAKDREKVAQLPGKKRKKIRTFISPSELLQIPLDQEKVKRYVSLKYKTELESDKNTIYCPRQWCNGAARSKKHKKPDGLELREASDDEEDDEDGGKSRDSPTSKAYNASDRLSICEECGYAFCSRCFQSWHGEFVHCTPRRENGELTEQEKASIEYLKLHTTPCPTCAAPAQKTQGCNHMICGRCQTHFCYLCSAWLDPGNPYQHFNEMPGGRITSCYMRLWELEHGDGDDVGHGFGGGQGRAVPRDEVLVEIDEPEDIPVVRAAAPAPQVAPELAREERVPENAGGPVGVAREGPLVLRIGGNQPVGAGRGGPRGRAVNAPAPVQIGRGGGHGNQNDPNLRGGGRGRGRGRGGGPREQQQAQRAPRGDFHGVGPVRGAAPGQRVRGGRGGGAPLLAPGPPAHPPHRQNVNQGANQAQAPAAQQRRNNNINDNPNQNQINEGDGQGGDAWAVDLEAGNGAGGLNAAQEAWIRQFVQLAMDDEEDEMAEDVEDWV